MITGNIRKRSNPLIIVALNQIIKLIYSSYWGQKMSDEVTYFVCVFFLLVLIHLFTPQISTFLNSFNPLIFY